MKFIKRFMAVILTILLFAVSVAGCASSKEQASDMLTREEWIAMLMEAYHMDECYNTTPVFADVSTQSEYFVQIQSCAEWEIVDKTSRFYPELTATNLFAIVTAVRAVGLDKVEKTKDAPSLESAEKIADYFLQQTNMKLDMSDDLTAKTAQQILDASLELAAGLVLEQYHDLQYQDGVLEISENDIAIDYEKQTAELHGIQAEAGTVIVVSPSATLPDGLMAKVTSVDGTRISFENAEMEEVIDSLLLYGTYAPEILRVTPLTDGVTAEYGEEASASAAETLGAYTVPKAQTLGLSGSAPSVQSMLKKEIEVEDAVLKLDKKLEENGAQVRINGSVGIKDILVTAELDCSLMKFNKASLQVDSTIAADISVFAKLDRTFKLAKIECRLWKVVGVDFIVSLHIDLNGNISVEFSVENCEGVSYKPDAKPKCFAKFQKPELEAQVQVQASAEPSITAELVIGPWSVTNIGAEVDLNAEAKVLSTEDGLICTDVKMYVLVSAFVGREAQNGDETLLAKFGVQKNWDIWTKDNTKMKKAWHVENGQVVPSCTRGTSLQNTESSSNEQNHFDEDYMTMYYANQFLTTQNDTLPKKAENDCYYFVELRSGTRYIYRLTSAEFAKSCQSSQLWTQSDENFTWNYGTTFVNLDTLTGFEGGVFTQIYQNYIYIYGENQNLIYKINCDDPEDITTIELNFQPDAFFFYDDKIYYVQSIDPTLENQPYHIAIYQTDLNGSNKKMLVNGAEGFANACDREIYHIYASSGYLYFILRDDGFESNVFLYCRCRLDGTEKEIWRVSDGGFSLAVNEKYVASLIPSYSDDSKSGISLNVKIFDVQNLSEIKSFSVVLDKDIAESILQFPFMYVGDMITSDLLVYTASMLDFYSREISINTNTESINISSYDGLLVRPTRDELFTLKVKGNDSSITTYYEKIIL